jgi:hypothetical protein
MLCSAQQAKKAVVSEKIAGAAWVTRLVYSTEVAKAAVEAGLPRASVIAMPATVFQEAGLLRALVVAVLETLFYEAGLPRVSVVAVMAALFQEARLFQEAQLPGAVLNEQLESQRFPGVTHRISVEKRPVV